MKLRVSSRAALPALLLALAACSHQTRRRQRAEQFLAEESKTLTTAVVDTLSEQPPSRRDAWTATALQLARQDQRLEGLPIAPIQVQPLISSNLPARAELAARFAEEDHALARRQEASEKLVALGERKEAELNAQRRRWFAWTGAAGTTIAAVILLAVFCPLALPLLGRLLGWLVEKIPSWAGAVGVVSVNAFDAVIRGVERTRKTAANTALDANLEAELDRSHKGLVESRKSSLK